MIDQFISPQALDLIAERTMLTHEGVKALHHYQFMAAVHEIIYEHEDFEELDPRLQHDMHLICHADSLILQTTGETQRAIREKANDAGDAGVLVKLIIWMRNNPEGRKTVLKDCEAVLKKNEPEAYAALGGEQDKSRQDKKCPFGPTYRDDKGELVVVSSGTGTPPIYGSFRVAPSGAKHRVKSKALPMRENLAQAVDDLAAYASKKKWQQVPGSDEDSGIIQPVADTPLDPAAPAPPAPVDEYAERAVFLHHFGRKMGQGSILCAGMAGAVMLQRKATLKGNFTKWKEATARSMGVSSSTADNYIALAKRMDANIKTYLATHPDSEIAGKLAACENSQRVGKSADPAAASAPKLPVKPGSAVSSVELLAALDPTDMDAILKSAIAEVVREVAPEDSLRQLYFAWGIVKPPKHKGGPRKSTKAENDRSPEEQAACEREAATAEWERIALDVGAEGLDKASWSAADTATLKKVMRTFVSVVKDIKEHLKQRGE